ncbi:hypothetical protein CLV56_0955 [Mumia flava]|uniref:DUF1269 domain-containing protein n=1 Tax=Mumia flava TaxID=1348852 RepID=A0A0B2B2M4_9ACTN|nr:DUF6325 family protein [Mumia flava]PJJ56744.1 hypothetical protein CLV56_0955 [Mumia flava]
MTDETLPGPVDFILVEFPGSADIGPAAQALTDLVDSGTVRLYDVAVLRKAADGSCLALDLGSSDDAGGFAPFAGARSDMFDETDLAESAEALEPDTIGLLVAYENAWAVPFVNAAFSAGAQVVASERIPAQTIVDVLEAAEAAENAL